MFLESGVHFDQQSLHSLDLMHAVDLFSDYTKTCGIISYYTTFLLMSKLFLYFLLQFLEWLKALYFFLQSLRNLHVNQSEASAP